jgi:MFS superfamily sulfate permease-like transporter
LGNKLNLRPKIKNRSKINNKKTGLTNAQEGVAVGRSFAMFKNYHIDGNKEMIAFGMMNIAGSCASCYLTTGTNSMCVL